MPRAAGQTVALGTTYPDATEGWFVPTSIVSGANAVAPDLKSVTDLPKYNELFADPEEPGKGRFYNCPAGWQCEVVNSKKLIAYGLDDKTTPTSARAPARRWPPRRKPPRSATSRRSSTTGGRPGCSASTTSPGSKSRPSTRRSGTR